MQARTVDVETACTNCDGNGTLGGEDCQPCHGEGFATIHIPGRFVTCGRCQGEGKHTNPAIDGNGITRDEMDEMGPDFEEDYFRGVYDVTCEECHGQRVTLEPNLEALKPSEREAVLAMWEEESKYAAECAAERRAGC